MQGWVIGSGAPAGRRRLTVTVTGAALATAFGLLEACGGASSPNLGPDQGDAAVDGTQPDGARPDGGGPGTDGAAGNDGATPDSGTKQDANGPGYCASQPPHFFCDDWDTADLKTGWDALLVGSNADAKLDTTQFKSPARSYLAETLAPVQNQQAVALLQKDVPKFREITYGMDVFVESYGSDVDAGLPQEQATFLALTQVGDASFSLALFSPDVAALVETQTSDAGPPTRDSHLLAGLPPGKWVRVGIVIKMAGAVAAGHVTVTYDGQTALDTPLTLAPQQVASQFALGLFLGNAPNVWKVHYDNLTIDKVP